MPPLPARVCTLRFSPFCVTPQSSPLMPALILGDLASADWAGAARSAASRTAARKTARQVILLRRAGHTLKPLAALLKDGVELGPAHFEFGRVGIDPFHKGRILLRIPAAFERSAIRAPAIELE